jgi:hypothetical protein
VTTNENAVPKNIRNNDRNKQIKNAPEANGKVDQYA